MNPLASTAPHIVIEQGDDVCCECGRPIRNIIRVNGVAHGPICGEKYLPATQRALAQKDFGLLVKQAKRDAYYAEADTLIEFAAGQLHANFRTMNLQQLRVMVLEWTAKNKNTVAITAMYEGRMMYAHGYTPTN